MRLNSTIVNILKVFATLMVYFCHSTIVAKECFGGGGLIKMFNTPAWGGVWMFLIISGLLAGYGFETGRYQLNLNSIKQYYKGRITKVLIPTWIFLTLVFIFNMRDATIKWDVIFRMLTCTYNGGFTGVYGAGATWYVFMLMWLYLLAPLFFSLLQKYEGNNKNREFKAYLKLLGYVIALGLCYRVVGFLIHLDTYNWLYANVLACIDLFVAGMICARMIKVFPKNKYKRLIGFRLLLLMLFVFMNFMFIITGKIPLLSPFYHYISPSCYILFTCSLILLYSADIKPSKVLNGMIGKVCNIICPFSFAFYLWHTSLLAAVADSFSWITNTYCHYAVMMCLGTIVVSYVSFLMTKMNNALIKK